MYDRILIPTDGGPGTEGATTRALDFARTFDASVHALYVVDQAAGRDWFPDAGDEAIREAFAKRGRTATESVASRAAPLDVDVVREVREGSPYRVVLDYAEEHDASLVVMATRTGTEPPAQYLGSTTERVVVRSERPVLTTGPDDSATVFEARRRTYDRVLIPTDGSDVAERAANHGLTAAERYGADVRVVYVVDTTAHGATNVPPSAVGPLKQGGRNAVQSVAEEARERNLSASTAVLRGVPEAAILRYAQGAGVDLIAMGTRGQAGVEEQFLGSTTARVVGRSDVPVLTVHYSRI